MQLLVLLNICTGFTSIREAENCFSYPFRAGACHGLVSTHQVVILYLYTQRFSMWFLGKKKLFFVSTHAG